MINAVNNTRQFLGFLKGKNFDTIASAMGGPNMKP